MPHDDVKVTATTLMDMLDSDALAMIGKKTNVDFHARKLKGLTLLKLILEGLFFCRSRLTLEGLSQYYKSPLFLDKLGEIEDRTISKAGLSKRLNSITPLYYKEIYEDAIGKWDTILSKAKRPVIPGLDLVAVDSTLVTQTARILREGISYGRPKSGGESRKGVKYTLGFNGVEALDAAVHLQPEYADEDKALGEAIQAISCQNPLTKDIDLFLFDRGIKSAVVMDALDNKDIRFIGRMNSHRKMELVRPSQAPEGSLQEDAQLLRDDIVRLYGKDGRELLKTEFRVITVQFDHEIGKRIGKNSAGESQLTLITNEMDLSVAEILEAYRFRWKIELFFKFLKQNLDLSHLMTGAQNGLEVMLYITLLAAALLKAYCILNDCGPKFSPLFIACQLKDSIDSYIDEYCRSRLDPAKYSKTKAT